MCRIHKVNDTNEAHLQNRSSPRDLENKLWLPEEGWGEGLGITKVFRRDLIISGIPKLITSACELIQQLNPAETFTLTTYRITVSIISVVLSSLVFCCV